MANKSAKKQRKKERKKAKREKKRLAGCEHRSDRRTAEFIVRRVNEVQEEISDLILEFRGFDHFVEVEYAALCVRMLGIVKKKYVEFADDGVWPPE
jgi:hypothetical protein